jgi:hypothetical protein
MDGMLRRSRLLGLGAALSLHALALTALVLGRHPEAPMAEPPTMAVQLVTPPPPSRTRLRPQPQQRHHPMVAHRPRPLPPSPETALPPAFDPAWTVRPDPSGGVGTTLAARRRCADDDLDEADWAACPPRARAPVRAYVAGAPKAKQDEYARATQRKDAIKLYKSTLGAPFPGLRCSFGRAC